MNLSPYLESVRTGVQNAAALADENTQQVAYKLGTAVESATRLAMISALSDAAGVISATHRTDVAAPRKWLGSGGDGRSK